MLWYAHGNEIDDNDLFKSKRWRPWGFCAGFLDGTEILGILFLVCDFGYIRSTNVMVKYVQSDIHLATPKGGR